MRIAMVSEHASPLATLGGVDAGGQNVHVAALAAGLARRGHDVTVFTRRDAPSLPTRVPFLNGTAGYVVEHVPAGPAADLPKDELLEHMHAFEEYLTRRLATESFDLVHAHFWMSGLASLGAGRRTGTPVVQTFHALGTVKRRHQGAKDTSPPNRLMLEARLARRVDHVVATCTDEVAELAQLGMHPSRATVIPCGVDTDLFRPGEPQAPSRRVLVVGRLVERKGVGNAIQALASVPGATLTVAGGPPREQLDADAEVARLRRTAQEYGVADRVRFLGAVTQAEVPALMHSCDVVVCAPWYEPFGIVPLEAMACGRPVLGTTVGGLLDSIVDGVTGDLVPPRRPDLLASSLRALLDDPLRQAAYGRAGRQRVLERYRWATVAEATEDVYMRIASSLARTAGVLR